MGAGRSWDFAWADGGYSGAAAAEAEEVAAGTTRCSFDGWQTRRRRRRRRRIAPGRSWN